MHSRKCSLVLCPDEHLIEQGKNSLTSRPLTTQEASFQTSPSCSSSHTRASGGWRMAYGTSRMMPGFGTELSERFTSV